MTALEQYQKEAIKTAKELCYKPDIVRKLKKAKSESEICRIMIDARHSLPDDDF